MKFDPAKAWPHPVLRPPSYGDDYPRAEFEVDIELRRVKHSTAVQVHAVFELSDPDLLRLVALGSAHYVLLVKAPRTHYRESIDTTDNELKKVFPAGMLSGRTEFSPFLICTGRVSNFTSNNWHPEFSGRSFDLQPGVVLAQDVPKEYWIDTAEEAPLGSIFAHKERLGLSDGQWEYELAEDHVWIVMSRNDSVRYGRARELASNHSNGQYLMNGLYLPALLAVLTEVDQNPEEYRHMRWFSSLDNRLDQVQCPALGSTRSNRNRLVDAQKILDYPFLKMPLIAELDSEAE